MDHITQKIMIIVDHPFGVDNFLMVIQVKEAPSTKNYPWFYIPIEKIDC